MRERKIPLRMCLGCSQMLPKKSLCRVVKNAAGEVALDFTGKMPGRGAYVCPRLECLTKARKIRRFERALSSKIPDDVYARLEEEMRRHEE
jgi:predicted RNA-binding protein YlxR (DUF448 family)